MSPEDGGEEVIGFTLTPEEAGTLYSNLYFNSLEGTSAQEAMDAIERQELTQFGRVDLVPVFKMMQDLRSDLREYLVEEWGEDLVFRMEKRAREIHAFMQKQDGRQ